jgi:hypothetical protein
MVRTCISYEDLSELISKNPRDDKVLENTLYLLPASAESIYHLKKRGNLLTGNLFYKAIIGDPKEDRRQIKHNRAYPATYTEEIFWKAHKRLHSHVPSLRESAMLAARKEYLAFETLVHPYYVDIRQLKAKTPENRENLKLVENSGEGLKTSAHKYLQNFQQRQGVIAGLAKFKLDVPVNPEDITFISFLSPEDEKAFTQYLKG